jgi:glycosyltransferase involved in cell wall biosynthesis
MSAAPAVKADVLKLPSLADRPLKKIGSSRKRLRIAQVAPLSESVPPKLYGGTERVVATLCDELVRQGHDVTLFASGDSQTDATLVAGCPTALRLSGSADPLAIHLHMIERVAQRADEFDLLHFHVAPLHFSVARRLRTPHVTTLHGRLDLAPVAPLYSEFGELPLVSVSDAQRVPLPNQNWVGTVYHGLPARELTFRPEPGSYLAFLGRIAREKRPDRAIAIAKACGITLKIAAKVDPADVDYFTQEIEPLLDDPLVEFIGEISEAQKGDFLGHARALLFPIDWPEPFGLVMIESLACGTPVVAFRGGSVGEIIEPGVTGFVVDTLDQAITAATQVEALDRRACREAFEQRFSATRMADDYQTLYSQLVSMAANVGH